MIFEEEFPSLTAGLYNIDKIGVEACCLDKERVRDVLSNIVKDIEYMDNINHRTVVVCLNKIRERLGL